MWIVLPRQPRPPARVWTGRISLAIADAIGWPVAWIFMMSRLTLEVGLVGRVSVAVALLLAVRGVWIAVRRNERYRFFTWRVWSLVWPLLAIGVALQVAFWLTG
jgi:hypothetical protein